MPRSVARMSRYVVARPLAELNRVAKSIRLKNSMANRSPNLMERFFPEDCWLLPS